MHITKDNVSDVTVARLVGTLDGAYAQEVHDGIVEILLDRQPVLLDFSGVPHVAQDGLRTMLAIYRQAQALDGKVCVVGVTGELHLALRATGFLRFFLVADDVEDGVAVLQEAADDSDQKIEEKVAS
ncbi:STAS domain-containing protein [Krasilnikovia sp. M28-CT-15]|uniref:STAS domain-containing protein n=1 Tax=Krasilnikovia sp. M28-CT-15 TaxID=3373540 RepID=UPI0038763E10